jgi:hypothetical protein
MSKKIEYIKPQKFYELFEELGECVHNKIFEKMDRDLFEDRNKWIDENFDWDDYKNNDKDSREYVRDMNIESVCWYIGQILLFGRIVKENQYGEYNLPKGEVPLYLRQIDDDGNEDDLYDVSSLKIMKKWSKSEKGKKKLREAINE